MEWREKSSEEKKRMKEDVVSRLREFLNNEACSCSMDFGCITPEYVYRMWGGSVPLNEIEEALKSSEFSV